MRAFLTGSTGFIGQPLARALLLRGWEVRALVRDPASPAARALESAGALLVQGDVTQRESMRPAMAGVDLVFHNAGWYELGIGSAAREQMHRVNVLGTQNVLGLAAELRAWKIIYTSSTTALGDTAGALVDESFRRGSPPLSYYEQTKMEAHALAIQHQQRGAPVVIVCPAQAIGPGDHSPFGHLARLYVRGLLPPAVWAPEAAFSMAHVDDVAEAIALAGQRGRPGEIYFIAGSVITNREIIQIWKKTPGGLKPIVWLPRPLAWLTGLLAEPVLRLAGLPAFISREAVDSSYVSFRYSSARAEHELGASFRSAEQAWLDTLAAERAKREGHRSPVAAGAERSAAGAQADKRP